MSRTCTDIQNNKLWKKYLLFHESGERHRTVRKVDDVLGDTSGQLTLLWDGLDTVAGIAEEIEITEAHNGNVCYHREAGKLKAMAKYLSVASYIAHDVIYNPEFTPYAIKAFTSYCRENPHDRTSEEMLEQVNSLNAIYDDDDE